MKEDIVMSNIHNILDSIRLFSLYLCSKWPCTFQVSEIEARSALIQLALPEWDPNEFEIDPADFRFTLLLSDKGKEGKYKLVYRYRSEL